MLTHIEPSPSTTEQESSTPEPAFRLRSASIVGLLLIATLHLLYIARTVFVPIALAWC